MNDSRQSVVFASSDEHWNHFVHGQSSGSIYHTTVWRDVITEAFGKKSYFLQATGSQGKIAGVLPLVHIESRLLGNRLVSMPYANYGGVLAKTDAVADQLRSSARNLSTELGAKLVELRETEASPQGTGMAAVSEKVIMRLALPDNIDDVGRFIGAKKRSQVKRPLREGAEVLVGGSELLGDFYAVFSRNMRDLGTPVYPKRFFDTILRHCPQLVRIIVIRVQAQPAAACFLIRWQDVMEIPWAASSRNFNSIGVNMLLYWEAISLAIDSGCRLFDLGRTTPNSGTWRFKKQWGANPLECRWQIWPKAGKAEDDTFRRIASLAWQKMPIALANRIGPWISPNLPW